MKEEVQKENESKLTELKDSISSANSTEVIITVRKTLEDKEEERTVKERSVPIITFTNEGIDELKKQITTLSTNRDETQDHTKSIDEIVNNLKEELDNLRKEYSEQQEELENKIDQKETQDEEYNQKQNDINSQHDLKQKEMKGAINDLSNTLCCIKHELKKLINETKENQENITN